MWSHRSTLFVTLRQLRSIALLSLTLLTLGWKTAAHAEPFAYIGSSVSDTIQVLDTATNTVVDTVPVGNYPYGVAVTPNGRFVYVTRPANNSVSVIDATNNNIIASVPVGTKPIGVAVTPDGASVYVANSDSNTVSVIATNTNTIEATIPVPGPYGVAVTPDGASVYVTSPESFTVSAIDTATKSVTPIQFPESQRAVEVAVAPDSQHVYVTLDLANEVAIIDTNTRQVVDIISVPYSPLAIAVTPDGASLYVADGNRAVLVINTADNTVDTTIQLGAFGHSMAVTPDGAFVYVTTLNNTVLVIATDTNTVVATTSVERASDSFGQFIGPVVCGNGRIGGGQQCDDGNTSNGDGCSQTCTVEPDYICSGEPSVCLPSNRAPVAQCHNVTVSTTGNTCAVASASINNGSSDPDGDPLTSTQTPAGPYGLGARTVTLTVSDGTLSSQCTGTVTVSDGQAPTISCPANQTVPASSNSGAVVNFSPTASDNCGTIMTNCSPSSGAAFPVGTTPVTCTATDGAGLQTSCGFTVTVTTSVLTQLDGLIATVQGLPVQPTVKLMLTVPLRTAKAALERNQPQVACASLRAFEGIVTRLRRANTLTAAQATQFTTASQKIRTAIGCP